MLCWAKPTEIIFTQNCPVIKKNHNIPQPQKRALTSAATKLDYLFISQRHCGCGYDILLKITFFYCNQNKIYYILLAFQFNLVSPNVLKVLYMLLFYNSVQSKGYHCFQQTG